MTVEEVYTNAFSARLTAWIETGNSPYLQDTNTDFIEMEEESGDEGDWTFPNSAGSGTINSVKLRLEARKSAATSGSTRVYVWDGSAWKSLGGLSLTTSYAWYELDVTSILNSWAKINGAKVYVHYTYYLSTVNFVRRLTRKVDYTPVVVVPKMVGDGLTWIIG